ncbi:MAG: OmpP1/FadL family transporter [Pseudomonadota bacterium]|nr:OmpP1/FadL family transporter [Pseudomonadota bacterium]
MSRPFVLLRALLCSAFLASFAASLNAEAAGFQLKEDSAVGLGMAFAGAGSAANTPATVFDNPAGMTRLPGLQIMLGASLIAPSAVFHGSGRTALGQPVSGNDGADAGNLGIVPHGFVSYGVTPDLVLGLALTSPFGLATTYPGDFVGRYQAEKTTLQTLNINPSIGYRVLPWLSVGAGVSAMYARAEFSNFINSSTAAASVLGRPIPLPDGHFRLRGDDWSFGYNFGILVQPGPQTNIGLTYRSRVQQNFSGTADFVVPAPLNLSNRFASSGGSAKLVLPDTVGVSVTQGIGMRLLLAADVTWTNWSQFKQLNAYRSTGTLLNSTPQHYDNSYFVSLGAAYQLTDRLTLRGGTAYDKSPVSNAYRTARVPDEDRVWLAGGLSYKVMANTTLDAGYAHIFVLDSRIRETSATGDVLTGRYKNSIDIVSLGTRMQF